MVNLLPHYCPICGGRNLSRYHWAGACLARFIALAVFGLADPGTLQSRMARLELVPTKPPAETGQTLPNELQPCNLPIGLGRVPAGLRPKRSFAQLFNGTLPDLPAATPSPYPPPDTAPSR